MTIKEETVPYDGLCWDCLLPLGHGSLSGKSVQYHFFATYKDKTNKTVLRRLPRSSSLSNDYKNGIIYQDGIYGRVDLPGYVSAAGTFVQADGTRVLVMGRLKKESTEELIAFGFENKSTWKLQWSKSLQTGVEVWPRGMTRLADGGIAVYGLFSAETSAPKGIVWRFGADLEQRWAKTYLPLNYAISAAHELSDGSIMTLSEIFGSTAMRCHVQRVDSWGHDDCKTAGKCADTLLGDCDDQNPCTTDTCSGASGGCTSKVLDVNTPCGLGKTCNLLGFANSVFRFIGLELVSATSAIQVDDWPRDAGERVRGRLPVRGPVRAVGSMPRGTCSGARIAVPFRGHAGSSTSRS